MISKLHSPKEVKFSLTSDGSTFEPDTKEYWRIMHGKKAVIAGLVTGSEKTFSWRQIRLVMDNTTQEYVEEKTVFTLSVDKDVYTIPVLVSKEPFIWADVQFAIKVNDNETKYLVTQRLDTNENPLHVLVNKEDGKCFSVSKPYICIEALKKLYTEPMVEYKNPLMPGFEFTMVKMTGPASDHMKVAILGQPFMHVKLTVKTPQGTELITRKLAEIREDK
jgi:hypothetical protein